MPVGIGHQLPVVTKKVTKRGQIAGVTFRPKPNLQLQRLIACIQRGRGDDLWAGRVDAAGIDRHAVGGTTIQFPQGSARQLAGNITKRDFHAGDDLR